jgi:hypothetical protein
MAHATVFLFVAMEKYWQLKQAHLFALPDCLTRPPGMFCPPFALVKVDFSPTNESKSAASFCRQVAALVADMFCGFYLVKNHKIANNYEAREKTCTYWESLEL